MVCRRLCGIVCLAKCIVLLVLDCQDLLADWLLFKTFQEVEGYTLTIVLGVFMGISTILFILEIVIWVIGIRKNCSKICSEEEEENKKQKVYMLKDTTHPESPAIIIKTDDEEEFTEATKALKKASSTEELRVMKTTGSREEVRMIKRTGSTEEVVDIEEGTTEETLAAADEDEEDGRKDDDSNVSVDFHDKGLLSNYLYISMDIPTLSKHDMMGEIVNYLLLIFEDLPIVVLLNHVFAKGPCDLYWILFYSPARVSFSLTTTFLSALGKFLQAVLACCPCGCKNVFDIALHQKLNNHKTAAWCVIINSFVRLLLTLCLTCFAAFTFFTYNCYGVLSNPDCLDGNFTDPQIEMLKGEAIERSISGNSEETILDRFGLDLCPFTM